MFSTRLFIRFVRRSYNTICISNLGASISEYLVLFLHPDIVPVAEREREIVGKNARRKNAIGKNATGKNAIGKNVRGYPEKMP